ncbi:MAG: hypothetical protein Q8P12_03500, partial [bacterium]|nr:hypothetical protein [bacterium]
STPFNDSVSRMHDSRLRVFGRDVIYTPQVGAPSVIRGILQTGVQPEAVAPGVYALLFVKRTSFAPLPEPGDEITVDDSIYKIVKKEDDGVGGLRLLLRFHREAS